MSNYKIRVANEAESKEVQEFFVALGGDLVSCKRIGMVAIDDMKIYPDVAGNWDLYSGKEITLPELRDMVVLKRNDVGDATHTNAANGRKYLVLSDGTIKIWWPQNNYWSESYCYIDDLKPIEKKMKEYLVKSQNGKWRVETDLVGDPSDTAIEVPEGAEICIKLNRKICGFYKDNFKQTYLDDEGWVDTTAGSKYDWHSHTVLWQRNPEPKQAEFLVKLNEEYTLVENDQKLESHWIEIPEGAEIFNFYDRKDNLFFLKGIGENALFSNDLNDWEWKEWGCIDFDGVVCLWSRHTHPEELPFIDDESKQKSNDLREMLNFPAHPLNDQSTEIEKVRQSAWNKQEGGSHYKNLKIQPMQYALENKLDYAQANVVKYVTRHADKNGKEDLLKAIHNIELMIEFYYGDEK